MGNVVITGYGIIGPGINDTGQFKDVLFHKRNVLKKEEIHGRQLYIGRVAENELAVDGLLSFSKRLPKTVKMLLHAASEAVSMSGLLRDGLRVGVVVGSSGGMISDILYTSANGKRHPFVIGNMNAYSLASSLCTAFHINGLSYTLNNSCTSALDAVNLAKMLIDSGQLDICLAGGTDSTLEDVVFEGFSSLHVLSHVNDSNASGPFSGGKGFSMSEGAGVLVMERQEVAKKRGAVIRGEIGLSMTNQDAVSPYKSDPSGIKLGEAVDHCLLEGMPTYINSQALGISQNDRLESDIYKEKFASEKIPITSIKGMVGHAMGASGMFQLISSLISIENHFIPPVIGYDQKSTDGLLVVKETRREDVERVLITSQGYGGINSCMMVKRGER
jgi:3-oxoacyl-[acyl-carrier-protein] synthase II